MKNTMKRLLVFLSVGLLLSIAARVEGQSRPLGIDDLESWNRISETVLSPDGCWVAYKTEPARGDSKVHLCGRDGQRRFAREGGTGIRFTNDSRFLVFTVKPPYERVRELKRQSAPRDAIPGDALAIYGIESGRCELVEDVRSYKLPAEGPPWLGYQLEPRPNRAKPDGAEQDGRKSESAQNGFTLRLRRLDGGLTRLWPFVTGYWFAAEGQRLFFTSTGDGEHFRPGMYVYDLEAQRLRPVLLGAGDCRQVAMTRSGDRLAFLLAPQGADAAAGYELYVWTGRGPARRIADGDTPGIPQGWTISQHGKVWFSASGRRVFFGTAPVRPARDPDVLDEEFPDVDVWHGGEGWLHSVQLVNRQRDLRRTYLALFDLDRRKLTQIEPEDVARSRVLDHGDGDRAVLYSSKPYELESMWDPLRWDVDLLDLATGRRTRVAKGLRDAASPAPGGEYLIWFDYADRSYHTYHIDSGKTCCITKPDVLRADEERNTTFDYSAPYGSPGWLDGDRAVLIYDRYDLWSVVPEGRRPPENLTKNGRTTRTVYRLLRLGHQGDAVDESRPQWLLGVNEVSRRSGYYRCSLKGAAAPERLLGGAYHLSHPQKAAAADTVVFTKETFQTFPDLWASDLEFKQCVRLSDANPQQADFLWGTAELCRWTSLDGQPLEGILYKPEDFDPSRKYPMIVQFFHRSSDQLYHHRPPELSRSRIDYHYFVSNGYVVFNPDIHFDPGYIGESAYKSIMPGVTALVDAGFIDPKRIGVQGHSYSGYQAAYLATRTRMFACIQAGAPVVNFFSAYGGIRWETGRARVAQYEHDQTRASIWEAPLVFLENSPLFAMDKVTTPILIMHNDRDGAVPWSQGIEYFVALRRLQKPVWMLNYNGEGHGLSKLKNRRDFQIRLAQFFGHYLKGEPMPRWMREGVPAVDKDHDLGYERMPNGATSDAAGSGR